MLLSCGMRTLSCGMRVGSSSLTRDQTHVPCIGRQIHNHCATREVPTETLFVMESAQMSFSGHTRVRHTVEYYSAVKRNKTGTSNLDEPPRKYAE